MNNLEKTLYDTDFSKYTDLKERLAKKLFSGTAEKSKVVQFPFAKLSDDQIELVNAAQGLSGLDPFRDRQE